MKSRAGSTRRLAWAWSAGGVWCRAGTHARDGRRAVQVRSGAASPTNCVGADEGGAACRARTTARLEKPATGLLPDELVCSADRRELARVGSQVLLDRHLEMPELDDWLQSPWRVQSSK